jgi:glycosyltransferase involved in cell wall biosynthesis
MPLRNDWAAVLKLLSLLDAQLSSVPVRASVILIDDGSTEPVPCTAVRLELIDAVHVVRLRRNVGHQRAIAIGLAWIHDNVLAESVIVMDADGEDRPEDVPRLLERLAQNQSTSIVFAERLRRSEGFVFQFFYWLYRSMHLLLTGLAVRVGNFSAIPFGMLANLVVVSDLWNHYSAAVFKARFPYELVGTSRGERLSGQSQMNFTSLVAHGLSAIAVFAETAGIRLMMASLVASLISLALIAVLLVLRFAGTVTVPLWTNYALAILVVLLAQGLAFTGIIAFLLLATRNSNAFIPSRDYAPFVRDVLQLWECTTAAP